MRKVFRYLDVCGYTHPNYEADFNEICSKYCLLPELPLRLLFIQKKKDQEIKINARKWQNPLNFEACH